MMYHSLVWKIAAYNHSSFFFPPCMWSFKTWVIMNRWLWLREWLCFPETQMKRDAKPKCGDNRWCTSLGIICQETSCHCRHLKLNSALQTYGNIKHMCSPVNVIPLLLSGKKTNQKVHFRTVLQDKVNVGDVFSQKQPSIKSTSLQVLSPMFIPLFIMMVT